MQIIDSHIHLYDNAIIPHQHLSKDQPLFRELLGDYSDLPKQYLWPDYKKDTESYNVEGIVWHEFVSDMPDKELAWASKYLDSLDVKSAMVAKIDFSDANFIANLEAILHHSRISVVRQHMACHPYNPLMQFSTTNYFEQQLWRNNLKSLSHTRFKCGLEIFSNQFSELIKLMQAMPEVQFTLGLMGWPYDVSDECFNEWRHNIKCLKPLDNYMIGLDGFECILGMDWTVSKAKPWIDVLLDTVGIARCMFGSHCPISKLSTPFHEIIRRNQQLLPNLSEHEAQQFYYTNANQWFDLK